MLAGQEAIYRNLLSGDALDAQFLVNKDLCARLADQNGQLAGRRFFLLRNIEAGGRGFYLDRPSPQLVAICRNAQLMLTRRDGI